MFDKINTFDKIKIFFNNLFHIKSSGGVIQAHNYPHPSNTPDVGELSDVRITQPLSDSEMLTYDSITRKWVNDFLYHSAGFLTYTGSVSDGAGAVTFPSEQVALYNNAIFDGSPKKYTLTGGKTGVGLVPALADQTTTYLVGDYNSGSPKFTLTTNEALILESSVVPYETLYRDGNSVYILQWDELGEGLSNKIHQRLVRTDKFARESGLALGETVGNVVTVGSGMLWIGAVKNSLADFDSSVNDLDFFYHVSSAWTETVDVGTYNNTQYDDGTDLQSLVNPTDYTINWIYRNINSEDKVHFILGSASYANLPAAQAATTPTSLPSMIVNMCILVGRIIVQNGAASGTIESSFVTTFAAAGITRHSDLSGLLLDDHTQYALLVGRAGGQVLIGGTLASQTLTLSSTAHATKGKILFGTSAYDEVNNRLGIGLITPAAALNFVAGTTAATGILFGADTNLYRSAANVLKTDDSFTVVGTTTLAALSGLLKGTVGVVSAASAGTDYEVPLTFSTGLTRAVDTITVHLSTGFSGGQSVIGGAVASENLTLSSTANATKGNIIFGSTAGMYWDEVNKILQFTNDTNLYRSAVNTLKTDDNFIVGGTLDIVGITTLQVALTGILIASAGVVTTAVAGVDYQAAGNYITPTTGVFTSSIVVPKTSGTGILIDTASPTFGWRDIIGDVSPKTSPPGAATVAVFIGGYYRTWFYSANDQCDCIYHVPHDYVAGTDIFLHLHWGHNGTAISGSLVVTFGVTYAKGHNQANFPTEVNPVLTVSTPNIATVPRYRHRLDEFQLSSAAPTATQLNTALLEPDGLILVGFQVTIIPTITGGSTNLPAFFTLDIHYQSSNVGTKQLSPPFYV
jgi:hypothetical protein